MIMKANKHQLKAFLDWCCKKHDAYLVGGHHYDLKTPNEDALIKEYVGESVVFNGIKDQEVRGSKYEHKCLKTYDEFVAAVYSAEIYEYWSQSGGNYCLRHFCQKDTCSECLKGY